MAIENPAFLNEDGIKHWYRCIKNYGVSLSEAIALAHDLDPSKLNENKSRGWKITETLKFKIIKDHLNTIDERREELRKITRMEEKKIGRLLTEEEVDQKFDEFYKNEIQPFDGGEGYAIFLEYGDKLTVRDVEMLLFDFENFKKIANFFDKIPKILELGKDEKTLQDMESETSSSHIDTCESNEENTTKSFIFRKKESGWLIGPMNSPQPFKKLNGFDYLACLLRHPFREFHHTELYNIVRSYRSQKSKLEELPDNKSMTIRNDLGDAGETIDDKAKKEYIARLGELKGEIEEYRQCGREEEADKCRYEIDELTKQLSGRKHSKALSDKILKGDAIRNAIKNSIQKIHKHVPEMSKFLNKSTLKITKIRFSYKPVAPDSPKWIF